MSRILQIGRLRGKGEGAGSSPEITAWKMTRNDAEDRPGRDAITSGAVSRARHRRPGRIRLLRTASSQGAQEQASTIATPRSHLLPDRTSPYTEVTRHP